MKSSLTAELMPPAAAPPPGLARTSSRKGGFCPLSSAMDEPTMLHASSACARAPPRRQAAHSVKRAQSPTLQLYPITRNLTRQPERPRPARSALPGRPQQAGARACRLCACSRTGSECSSARPAAVAQHSTARRPEASTCLVFLFSLFHFPWPRRAPGCAPCHRAAASRPCRCGRRRTRHLCRAQAAPCPGCWSAACTPLSSRPSCCPGRGPRTACRPECTPSARGWVSVRLPATCRRRLRNPCTHGVRRSGVTACKRCCAQSCNPQPLHHVPHQHKCRHMRMG